MEHEAAIRTPVQAIANDGRAETDRGVDAQLVAAAGFWKRCDGGATPAAREHAPRRDRGSAIHVIDELARAIVEIDAQREVDHTGVAADLTVQDRDIALVDRAPCELR